MRSASYLRRVAALPCVYCGVEGWSQAAHANTGKGVGIKASDLDTFPLCADRQEIRGCHSLFDQGALFRKQDRREIERRWISWTRAALGRQ